MKHTAVWIALIAGSAAVTGLASAQTPPSALRSCTQLTDPGERLRCYDNQMGVGTKAPSPPEVAPAAAPPAAEPPAAAAPVPGPAAVSASPVATAAPPAPTPEAKFGAEQVTRAVNRKPPAADKVMVSSIASIRQIRPKVFVITLANGQVWMQQGTQITMFFKAGYDARVEKGLFGDYRMSTAQTGDKYVVRVNRIQ